MNNEELLLNNRYGILSQLGQGGSGITYLAKDLHSGEKVALKTISLRQLDDWKKVELFEREAKILQQLEHPAIPRYIDYFKIERKGDLCFYLVQQLAPGKSLATLIEEGWQPDEATVKHIAEQILDILIYLQKQLPPVFHRDIKPQNIIYCPKSENTQEKGQLFLVDFGSVQDTYHHTVTASTVVGTYGYMGPEQFRGQAILATDLYGLGTTLLFLLTRKSPVELPQSKLKINFHPYVNISSEFANWIERLIEPNSSDRFPHAKTALDVLQGKQSLKPKRPPYTSVQLTQTEEELIIIIPPAILHQRYNYSLAYLGVALQVILVLIWVRFIDLAMTAWSLISGSNGIMFFYFYVPIIILWDVFNLNNTPSSKNISKIYLLNFSRFSFKLLLFIPIGTNFFLSQSFERKDFSLIIFVGFGIVALILEHRFIAKIRKLILRDWLFKLQFHISREIIDIKALFFKRVINSQKLDSRLIGLTCQRAIKIYNHEHEQFGKKPKEICQFGILLTPAERAWLVGEIKQFFGKLSLSAARKIQEVKEKQLKKLDLSYINSFESDQFQESTKIPAEVFDLKQIESLSLSGNQLKSVPESLGNLTKLTILDLSGNPLVTPPRDIAQKGIESIKQYFRQLK